MTQGGQPLCTLPSFAGAKVCAAPGCDTILSDYNPDDVCAQCQRKTTIKDEESAKPCSVDLDFLVMALLCRQHALHPGELLDVGQALAAEGVEADSWQVQKAVRHMERRQGIIARGVRGHPGYAIVEVERRYRLFAGVVGFGAHRRHVLMMHERDEDGRFAGVAHLLPPTTQRDDDAATQPSLPGLEGFRTGS